MWSWLLHRFTGVILVFGLLYHFFMMHFTRPDVYSYQAVMQRLSEPSWKVFNIIFLLSALYHGFYGLNGLVTEYVKHGFLRKLLKFMVFFVPIGFAFFGFKIIFL